VKVLAPIAEKPGQQPWPPFDVRPLQGGLHSMSISLSKVGGGGYLSSSRARAQPSRLEGMVSEESRK